MSKIVGKIIKGVKENKFVKLDEEATMIKNVESGIIVSFLPATTEVEVPELEEKIILGPVDRFILDFKLNSIAKKKERNRVRDILNNI